MYSRGRPNRRKAPVTRGRGRPLQPGNLATQVQRERRQRSLQIADLTAPVQPTSTPTPTPPVQPTPTPPVQPTPVPLIQPTPPSLLQPTPTPSVHPTPTPPVQPTTDTQPSPVGIVFIPTPGFRTIQSESTHRQTEEPQGDEEQHEPEEEEVEDELEDEHNPPPEVVDYQRDADGKVIIHPYAKG